MIQNERWRRELKRLSFSIWLWSKILVFQDYAKHRLRRAVLYSAILLRKSIEEEVEVEAAAKEINILPPKPKVLHTSIKATRYPYTGEEGGGIRETVFAQDYGKGQDVGVKVKDVCNWLIHSYVWEVATSGGKNFAGFLVASDFDKEKCVYYIPFEEWYALLIMTIENREPGIDRE